MWPFLTYTSFPKLLAFLRVRSAGCAPQETPSEACIAAQPTTAASLCTLFGSRRGAAASLCALCRWSLVVHDILVTSSASGGLTQPCDGSGPSIAQPRQCANRPAGAFSLIYARPSVLTSSAFVQAVSETLSLVDKYL